MITDYFADANVDMDENEEIEVTYPSFFPAVAKILEETEPRTIGNLKRTIKVYVTLIFKN